MTAVAVFFYFFSAVMIASAFMVISARNPVHSVLFLILAFVNAAGLFLLLGAEFLALILVIVYVGAVAVLFLFVVMMLDVDFAELKQGFQRNLPIGATIGGIVLLELDFLRRSLERGRRGDAGNDASAARPLQHRGAGARALYAIYVSVRGRRSHPPGRDDRRDRPHLAA